MKGEWTVTTIAEKVKDRSHEIGLPIEVSNILGKVAGLLGKAQLVSEASPLAVLIITSMGGVVRKVDQADSAYEFSSPSKPPAESAKVIEIFEGTGLVCKVRLRTKKAPEPRKGVPAPPPAPAPIPEVFYILYPTP